MVKVKSFTGYLADPKIASEMASRPYDVITRSQAKHLSHNKEHSYYHVIRPEISLNDIVDETDPQVYALGRKNLENFITEGYLKKDTTSRMYVYQTEFKGIVSTGLFLLVSIEGYEKLNTVKKHELTREDKELDRTHLINTQDANAEPILITYRNVNTIEEIIENATNTLPYLSTLTNDDQAKHKVWLLTEEQSHFIEQQFAHNVESLYIADGHHRMAASYNVAKHRRQELTNQGVKLTGDEPFEYTMAFVVSSKCLKICGYHRIIKSLKGVSAQTILDQIAQKFDLIPLYENFEPKKKGDFSLLIDEQWFRMTVKPEESKSYLGQNPSSCQKLDVQLLQDLCVTPIFVKGIQDCRTDDNIGYVGGDDGIRGLEKKVYQEGASVAIACFPVHIDEVFDIADNNQIMTPKSTWIVPKPRSGFIMRTLF